MQPEENSIIARPRNFNHFTIRADGVAEIEVISKSERLVVLIDAADLPIAFLIGRISIRRCGKKLYAGGGGVKIFLHRRIMQPAPGLVVDHINHNGLDNRRVNLRSVTRSDNNFHRKGAQCSSALNIRGVHFDKNNQTFIARLMKDKKEYWIGRFDSKEEAQAAVVNAVHAIKNGLPYKAPVRPPKKRIDTNLDKEKRREFHNIIRLREVIKSLIPWVEAYRIGPESNDRLYELLGEVLEDARATLPDNEARIA